MKEMSKKIRILLLFLLVPLCLSAQTISVSGLVTDGTGEALIGVSVVEKGTINGVSTDVNGQYTLTVPSNATLEFSYLGYLTESVAVAGKTIINVVLKEDQKMLDEVVVIGYGTMKKSDLTGAVSSINSDAISKTVSTSIDQVLSGRAAGVQVQQNSGAPGAGSSIRIRGINSLNASTDPIFVIDGVIIQQGSNARAENNPLALINPADIVSMDILKDASATAIYGAQASNGVIIVNTKRGKKGAATVNYNGYMGWQQLPKHLDVLNLQQYAALRNIKAEYGQIQRNNNFIRPDLLGSGTDWQNELFNTAMMQNHNLSISGGSETSTYSLGAGYSNQDGIAEGSGFRRLTLSGSFDAKAKEWLRAGVNFGFSNTKQKLTASDESLVLMAIRSTPDVPIRNIDGTWGAPDGAYMPSNPMARSLIIDNHQYNSGARANTFLEITPDKLLKGLSYRTEFSFDLNYYNSYTFVPTYYIASWDSKEINEKTDSKQYNVYYSWRNIFTYDRTFGINKVTAMLGQEMSKSTWDYLSGFRPGLPTNGATDLTLGDATKAENNGYTGASSLMSYFGRLFYSYNDRYLLTTTLRRDGSSKFAPKNRWGWFPSAALAWRASEEDFLKNNSTIDNLKLRAGWGLVGNQNIPTNTAWMAVYSTVASPWGSGLRATNTPNEDLLWESTNSANIGLDVSVLRNRIELIVDFYLKKTNNLLMEASLPGYVGTGIPVQGFTGASSPPWVNLGSLENKGFEMTLNTVNVITKDFQWNTNLVFSLNRNKVISMNTASGEDTRSAVDNVWGGSSTIVNRTVVGQPIGQFYGYEVIGRFEKATDFYYKNAEGDIVRTPVMSNLPIDEENGVWIGDYIYKDQNHDGVIDEKDRAFIGNPEPKFTYGINNNFAYKNWDLGIQLVGVYGNDVVNYARRYMENPQYNNSNYFTSVLDYAQLGLIDPNGPNDYRNVKIIGGDPRAPRMPRSSANGADYDYVFSDRFVENGSYLRIQNVSLGYTLPQNLLHKIDVSNVKFYVNLQNLYTFTKYRGFDPEIGTQGTGSLRTTGVDNGRYPSPRIYTLGVNVTF
ncbi:MAG: TonB-dependent receptor [Candidatus Symbiothrix sp.]|jgi:TonB-linked SusC/RagA family outer membrane protein|nr:TonB-dependent receptor [Candidatus Symbiothrix sp.]